MLPHPDTDSSLWPEALESRWSKEWGEVAEKAQFGGYSDPNMSLFTVIINIRKVPRTPVLALYLMFWISELFILLRPE